MGTKIGKGMKDGNGNLGVCRIKKSAMAENLHALIISQIKFFYYILMCLMVIVNAVDDIYNMLCHHYHLFKFTTNFLSLVERVEINQSS